MAKDQHPYAQALFRRANRIADIEISQIVQISEATSALRAAAPAAGRAGELRYPPTKGTAKLRRVSAGIAGVTPDEVICPTPYWSSFRDIIRFAGMFWTPRALHLFRGGHFSCRGILACPMLILTPN